MIDLLSSVAELAAALAASEASAGLTYVSNQKALAVALGFTGAYVSQLKSAGRITPEADGTWCVETVRQQISNTSDLGQSMAAETRLKARTAPAAPADSLSFKAPDAAIAALDDATLDDAGFDDYYDEDHDRNFKIARSLRERELAATARLDRMEKEGLTLLKSDTDRAAFTEARVIRDSIMGFCTKIAPLLAPITDPFELERRLREGVRQVLADCVKRDEVTA